MAKDFRIPHGTTVKDCITGITGVVTGRSDYITGCDQYLVQPISDKKDKKPDALWFDDQRLVEVSGERVVEIPDQGVEKPGACEAAPVK